jgi:hypothetical protein
MFSLCSLSFVPVLAVISLVSWIHRQKFEVKNVDIQNVRQNAEWDIMSNGKNNDWDNTVGSREKNIN